MTEQVRKKDNPYISPPEQTEKYDNLCVDENGQIDFDALLAQYRKSRSSCLFPLLCMSIPFGIIIPIILASFLYQFVDQVYLYKIPTLLLTLSTIGVIVVYFRYCLIPPMRRMIRESQQLSKMIGISSGQTWSTIEFEVRSILRDAGKLPPRKSLSEFFGLTRKRKNDNI